MGRRGENNLPRGEIDITHVFPASVGRGTMPAEGRRWRIPELCGGGGLCFYFGAGDGEEGEVGEGIGQAENNGWNTHTRQNEHTHTRDSRDGRRG